MSLKSSNKVDTNKVELVIEIGAEDFEAAVQQAYLKNRGRIQVPGFRKGKAPRKLIEREYGEGFFYEEAINAIYQQYVNDAVKEAELELVARPDVEITSVDKEKGVEMKVTCTTKPVVEVSDYKGIEVEKTVKPVEDEDIERELKKLAEKNVRILTVDDRAAELGDTVTIDFEGFKDDVAFDGGKGEDFDLELGSGQFIPGFEDAIVGHSTGEQFDINVTFPEEYQVKDLAGAPAVFKINLKAITKKEYPKIDDELVSETTDFETLDAYKADIKTKLEETNEKAADQAVETYLLDKVVENMKGEIPEVMYDNRADEMVNELAMRLRQQGMTLELYMQYTGQSVDTLRKTYREQAEKQVKLRLALEQIVKNEGIEATAEEVEKEINTIAENNGITADEVRKYVRDEDVAKDIAVGKAVELVKDSAVIK
ncbi:MAG: trigger factor [Ruminococcus sp.]|nr:trigger factor [Ruminococcus sp.]